MFEMRRCTSPWQLLSPGNPEPPRETHLRALRITWAPISIDYQRCGCRLVRKGRGWPMSFMERVCPVIDETIRALAKSKFIEDTVAGVRYSRATSIVSSAYKRHG